MNKKSKRFIYYLVGFTIVFGVFIPPILIGLLLESILPFWSTLVALPTTLMMWLVIAFNLDKLDFIMEKLRKIFGVDQQNAIWYKKG